MVIALYRALRLFALELTATSLEALLVVVVVAAIVLYGREIRRPIEQIAPFGARWRAPIDRADTLTDASACRWRAVRAA
jgi:hypothetical protein